MKLQQLIDTYRSRADDRAAPFLHDDAEVTGFANEAEREAAERSLCLKDSDTPSICQIALVQGQRRYPLDARVIDVVSGRVRGMRDFLTRAGSDTELECRYHPPGIAQRFAVIEAGGTCVLVLDRDVPDPADVFVPGYAPYIDLTVYRRPLNTMQDVDDVPEINPAKHMDLIYWMLFLGYSTRDSDAGDDQKASTNDARFTLAFGEKIDANVKRKQLRHRPPVTRPECF